MKIWPILGLLAVAGCAAPSRSTSDRETLYRFGKAETHAEGITDVLDLLRRGDAYRNQCLTLVQGSEQGSFALVEDLGREAKNWYRVVIEREPSNGYASLCIGYVDLLLGRLSPPGNTRENYFSSAMSRFKEALEKRPGYADAYLYMAEVHALREEYDEAERDLRTILNSGIEDSQVHAWMAYVLTETRPGPEATQHVARSIELDNPSPAAQWSRDNRDFIAKAR